MKIIGTAESMEEGNVEVLSPSSLSMTNNDSIGKTGKNQDKTMSTAINLSLGDSQKTPPDMKNTSKLSVHRKHQRSWMPKWVSAAPTWLKCVIIVSMALLVGAVVLVTVALTTALAAENTASSATVIYPSPSAPSNHEVDSSPESTSTTGMLPYDTYTGVAEDLVDDDAGNKDDPVTELVTPYPTVAPTKLTAKTRLNPHCDRFPF